jgi:ADP-heptose:LPS heptosyltransferase
MKPYARDSSNAPKRILLIKGHSAGIGDILRSSAAWRALKNKFQDTELYLLLLTKEPGYVSERLIARHHLLKGFFVVDKRTRGFGGWMKFLAAIGKVVNAVTPDLMIDFEPHGLRTSLVSLWMRSKFGIKTVGINEVPGRGLFYNIYSSSTEKFARKRRLEYPLEYAYRDFVVLSSLGIERNGIPIELEETSEGRRFRSGFRERFGIPEKTEILGVNIGCGTPDAVWRRPHLKLLSRLIAGLQEKYKFAVILTGAKFEEEFTREFIEMHRKVFADGIIDFAETDILDLTGFIRACRLFISSDSGPYHMAVALRIPTIAVFNFDCRPAYHHHPWVKCKVIQTEGDVISLGKEMEEFLKNADSGCFLRRQDLLTPS